MKRKTLSVLLSAVTVLVLLTYAVAAEKMSAAGFAEYCRSAAANDIIAALAAGSVMSQQAWFNAAYSNQDPQVLRVLLDTGRKAGVNLLNATNKYGWTALMSATRSNKNPEVAKFLIQAGADVDYTTPEGVNALSLINFVRRKLPGRIEIERMLIRASARYRK
ncbi:MAG: ankyrin repeat domain-containing protein [Synergistaceae bacterium]|nr:ankyrin repeat domain-containing protein [Synergistaceae bacterium]MBQ9573732.1 ankyrin repeat domain-containing protein [Synergistaceae bacterium]